MILICFIISASTVYGQDPCPCTTYLSGSLPLELLEISDLFGSRLLPVRSAGWLPLGSFRPVAVYGNNPTRPPFCPHSTARRSGAVFRWSPTHFRYVDCCATVGVATQSRRLLVNSHLGAYDVLIVLSANGVINKPILCLGNHYPHLLHLSHAAAAACNKMPPLLTPFGQLLS